jgi:hypothetical protein
MDKLSNRTESTAIAPRSSTPSEKTVAKLLDLAAQSLGKELMSGESRLWLQAFQLTDPAALEWAFREFFLGHLVDQYGNVSGNFFPRIAQIVQLVDRYHHLGSEQRRDEEQKRMLDDMKRAREENEAAGQPSGLAQLHAILKQACERVKRMP